jgi:tRNA threonylcarbamoyladenosine biosynthesis protein TsaB
MKILAIDTTSPAGSVALLEDHTVLRVLAAADAAPYSSRLHRDVERLLAESAITLPQVDLYAVAAGPGSFTGVRVGLAAVKAWAEVYRKPVAAVSALEALAAQSTPQESLIAGVADAHRGQLFAGLYERTADHGIPALRRRGEDVVLPPAECLAYLREQAAGREFLIRTTTPEMVHEALSSSDHGALRIEPADPVLAPVIGLLGFFLARRGELGDALTLDAHYVRRSDAELLWKHQ